MYVSVHLPFSADGFVPAVSLAVSGRYGRGKPEREIVALPFYPYLLCRLHLFFRAVAFAGMAARLLGRSGDRHALFDRD